MTGIDLVVLPNVNVFFVGAEIPSSAESLTKIAIAFYYTVITWV